MGWKARDNESRAGYRDRERERERERETQVTGGRQWEDQEKNRMGQTAEKETDRYLRNENLLT